jgi:hypothetical protein
MMDDRPIIDDYGHRAKSFYGGYHTCDASKPEELTASVTSIFEDASVICPRFSNEQFAQGINELIGPADIEIERYLFSPDVSVLVRTACVRSMYHFYADVVPIWPAGVMPGIFYMLWHGINTFATCRSKSNAANHGLGHLSHPGVAPLVRKFIDDHRPEFSESGLVWVEQCRDGTVM